MAEEKKSGAGKFFLGALFGAAVGAIAGILTAPKSGKETRKDLKDAGDKAVKDAKKNGEKLLSKTKKSTKELGDKAEADV